MPKKLIALLLSGLILPGLGQLYLGQRRKGALILILVNCFLIAALFIVLPGIGKLLVAAQVDQATGVSLIANWLMEQGGIGKGMLAAFLAIWGYAVVDVLATPAANLSQ
jgi:TM2 domain-containing membrane protein YozV